MLDRFDICFSRSGDNACVYISCPMDARNISGYACVCRGNAVEMLTGGYIYEDTCY